MKFAYVQNGVVAEVLRVDPATVHSAYYAALFIKCPAEVEPGWLVSGSAWRAPPTPVPCAPTLDDYKNALQNVYNAMAAERRYDNYITCAMRAGYAGPYQAECAAFGVWMDTCNALGYSILDEVQAGTRAQPTIAELLALVPEFNWGE